LQTKESILVPILHPENHTLLSNVLQWG